MYRLFLALRYTLVRPVSYLAMVSIGLAVMALITVSSIMNGFLEETERVIRGTTADVTITPRPAPGQVIERESFLPLVLEHPDVAAAAPRFVRPAVFKLRGKDDLLGMAQLAEQFVVKVVGIDHPAERAATRLDDYLLAVKEGPDGGRYGVQDLERPFHIDRGRITRPELRFAPLPRVLMSLARMQYFGLVPGDALEVVTIPDSESLDAESFDASSSTFVIAGAYQTDHDKFDGSTLLIPSDDFPAWAGTVHEFNEIVVRARPGADLGALRDDLNLKLQQRTRTAMVTETWEDRNSIWLGAVKNERNILFVLFGFFLLLVCTITFSVLTMLVQQKVRDIGILSAMGATAGGVGAVFALSGVMIASLGGLFGWLAGELLTAKLNDVKDFVEWVFGIEIFSRQVYAFSEIPTAHNLALNLGIAAATVIGAVFICLLPSIRAARMDPVEALRHE